MSTQVKLEVWLYAKGQLISKGHFKEPTEAFCLKRSLDGDSH